MTKLPLFAGVAALSLLAGCWDNSGPEVNITTINSSDEAELAPANAATPANIAAPAAPETNTVEAESAGLALAPDGLTLVLDSGATRHANFGMDRDVVVPMVSAVLGKPTGTGRNGECGQGPMEMVNFKGGLDMEFQGGKFVGWSVDGREKGGYTLMNGIGIGSTLRQLRDAVGAVTVENSSLGDEFAAGDLSGLLTSLKPEATITDLWAGSICQFR